MATSFDALICLHEKFRRNCCWGNQFSPKIQIIHHYHNGTLMDSTNQNGSPHKCHRIHLQIGPDKAHTDFIPFNCVFTRTSVRCLSDYMRPLHSHIFVRTNRSTGVCIFFLLHRQHFGSAFCFCLLLFHIYLFIYYFRIGFFAVAFWFFCCCFVL